MADTDDRAVGLRRHVSKARQYRANTAAAARLEAVTVGGQRVEDNQLRAGLDDGPLNARVIQRQRGRARCYDIDAITVSAEARQTRLDSAMRSSISRWSRWPLSNPHSSGISSPILMASPYKRMISSGAAGSASKDRRSWLATRS